MARYSTGVLTGAGSVTLPLISLYAIATNGGRLRECGLTNTTATAVAVKLVRLTSAGTPGAALVVGKHDPDTVATLTPFGTHTIAPTLGTDLGYRAALGAAVGSGVIWTFGDSGLRIPVGVANGIGVIIENGTGQALQADLVDDNGKPMTVTVHLLPNQKMSVEHDPMMLPETVVSMLDRASNHYKNMMRAGMVVEALQRAKEAEKLKGMIIR
jgi:hypothetical protein